MCGQSALLLCLGHSVSSKSDKGGGNSLFGKHGQSGTMRLHRSPGCPEPGPSVTSGLVHALEPLSVAKEGGEE